MHFIQTARGQINLIIPFTRVDEIRPLPRLDAVLPLARDKAIFGGVFVPDDNLIIVIRRVEIIGGSYIDEEIMRFRSMLAVIHQYLQSRDLVLRIEDHIIPILHGDGDQTLLEISMGEAIAEIKRHILAADPKSKGAPRHHIGHARRVRIVGIGKIEISFGQNHVTQTAVIEP